MNESKNPETITCSDPTFPPAPPATGPLIDDMDLDSSPKDDPRLQGEDGEALLKKYVVLHSGIGGTVGAEPLVRGSVFTPFDLYSESAWYDRKLANRLKISRPNMTREARESLCSRYFSAREILDVFQRLLDLGAVRAASAEEAKAEFVDLPEEKSSALMNEQTIVQLKEELARKNAELAKFNDLAFLALLREQEQRAALAPMPSDLPLGQQLALNPAEQTPAQKDLLIRELQQQLAALQAGRQATEPATAPAPAPEPTHPPVVASKLQPAPGSKPSTRKGKLDPDAKL